MHLCKHQELPSALFLLSLFFKHSWKRPHKWILLGTTANTPMINCLAGLRLRKKKKKVVLRAFCASLVFCFDESLPKEFVNYSSIHPESNAGLFWSSLCWALPVQVSELPCSSSCSCWRLGWGAKGRMLILSDGVCVSGGLGRV